MTTATWTHNFANANGIRIHYVEQGTGFPVVMLHGFPELWYSWRHQIPALADAGYRAIAPDVRGYGQTGAPQPIEAYSMRTTTADIVGLLDALGEEQAVVVGHDWGAPIAWHCALLYPGRFKSVAALSVPYTGRPPMAPTKLMDMMFAGKFFYILYFQEPGVAEAELEADVRRSHRLFIHYASGDAPGGLALTQRPRDSKLFDGVEDPGKLPAWLREEDLDYYTKEIERTGFRGGLNRYRNMDRDWEELAELAGAKVQQPALFIGGEKDPVLMFARMDAMKELVPDLRGTEIIPGCGHWIQQEKPEEVNRSLVGFVREVAP